MTYADLNELRTSTIGEEGYAGIEFKAAGVATEIRTRCAKAKERPD